MVVSSGIGIIKFVTFVLHILIFIIIAFAWNT